jgi:hypothetical protein
MLGVNFKSKSQRFDYFFLSSSVGDLEKTWIVGLWSGGLPSDSFFDESEEVTVETTFTW